MTAALTPRRFGALSERSFCFFLAGYGLSWITYWIYIVSVGWFTWETTHSPFWLGLIYVCDLCPSLIVSPIGGALADRLDRLGLLRLMLWLQVANALLMTALAFLGQLDVVLLAILVFLEGVLVSISQPAFNGLVPRLISRANLPSAIALNNMMIHLSGVIGPLLAGLIYVGGLPAAGWAFLISALGTLFYIWCLRHVRFGPAVIPPSGRSASSIRHDIADGFRYMARTGYIVAAVGLTLGAALLARTLNNMLAGVNGRYALFQPAEFVWMTSAVLAGSVLAALLKAGGNDATDADRRSYRAFAVYALLWGLGFGALWAGWVHPLAALALLFLLGFSSTTALVDNYVGLQAQLDEARRGRVMGNMQMISRGGGALGALIAGLLAERIDFAPAFLVLLALAVICFGGGLLLKRRR